LLLLWHKEEEPTNEQNQEKNKRHSHSI
jgi:hypothetical protein